MNIKKIIAATMLITATGAVFADQANATSVPSGKTRAEVVAELQQASTRGLLATNDADFSGGKSTASGQAKNGVIAMPAQAGKTRSEVIAELKQAKNQGLIATNDADFSGGEPSVPGQSRNTMLAQSKHVNNSSN